VDEATTIAATTDRTRAARSATGTTPPAPGTPELTRGALVWGETWRVLVALLLGLMVFGWTMGEIEAGNQSARFVMWPLIDPLLGTLAVGLMLLRRRAPLMIALLLVGISLGTAAASGAALVATVSLATRRKPHEIVILGALFVPNLVLLDWFYPTAQPLFTRIPDWVVELGASLVGYAVIVITGAFIGARRDLVRTLRQQAAASEAEQTRRADQARLFERDRIAREMHDVLAHRLSLVAVHAGALAYRIDLSPDQVRETATVIRDGTHQALEELRGVLGMIRSTDTAPAADGASPARPARPERPQPTLDDLDELVAQSRTAGNPVRLLVDLDGGTALPTAMSRTAFRLLQEALTNARKHAPGARVVVEVHGGPGDGLTIRATNRVYSSVASGPPGAGLGLTGMKERAEVAGGALTYTRGDDTFELHGWLPWLA
jgi:signal transduction histidine kinase